MLMRAAPCPRAMPSYDNIARIHTRACWLTTTLQRDSRRHVLIADSLMSYATPDDIRDAAAATLCCWRVSVFDTRIASLISLIFL